MPDIVNFTVALPKKYSLNVTAYDVYSQVSIAYTIAAQNPVGAITVNTTPTDIQFIKLDNSESLTFSC